MKRFFPLFLGLCLLLTHVNAKEKAQTTEPEIHKMDNGLQIQSYDTRTLRDDLADMLGVWMWKIRLSTLGKNESVGAHLELRIPGQEPIQMGGFGVSSSEISQEPKPVGGIRESSFEKSDFVFAIQPLGDDSILIDTSLKIRLYSRMSSYWLGSETREPGYSHVIENPFRNLGGPSFPYEPPVRADGSILLVQFSPSGKDDDPKKSELVVVTSLQRQPSNAK